MLGAGHAGKALNITNNRFGSILNNTQIMCMSLSCRCVTSEVDKVFCYTGTDRKPVSCELHCCYVSTEYTGLVPYLLSENFLLALT